MNSPAAKLAMVPLQRLGQGGDWQVGIGLPVALPDADYTKPLRTGALLLVFGLLGFLAWASLAPLDEGVPAPGAVMVESHRKRVEHLSGGIVEQIRVREGQAVEAGAELVVLSQTQGRAMLNATEDEWLQALALRSRLLAERSGAATITWDSQLLARRGQAQVAALLAAQQLLLASRRAAMQGELRLIAESVRGLEQQLASLEQLRAGRQTQLALFDEQLDSLRKLRGDGFVSRLHLLELERQRAEVLNRQAEDLSSMAATRSRLEEFRMRSAQRQLELGREVEEQLTQVQRELAGSSQRLAGQRDVVERLVLRAPVAGTVVDLAVHTVGGVVRPGDRVMDIVPGGEPLVVEARLDPQHIDRVAVGLPADVHFDAYASRTRQPVRQGQVQTVSADALTDPRTGAAYYAVRVRLLPQAPGAADELKLQPGMTASVMVKTGERSLIAYLLRPLSARVRSALAEH